MKIIFTSGYDQRSVFKTTKMVDAKFIAKPYSIQKLLATVRASFDDVRGFYAVMISPNAPKNTG